MWCDRITNSVSTQNKTALNMLKASKLEPRTISRFIHIRHFECINTLSFSLSLSPTHSLAPDLKCSKRFLTIDFDEMQIYFKLNVFTFHSDLRICLSLLLLANFILSLTCYEMRQSRSNIYNIECEDSFMSILCKTTNTHTPLATLFLV